MKKPTLRRQVEVFHKFMHIVNLANISGKDYHLKECLWKMDSWSHAHRQGNGEFSDQEQNQLVYKAFESLADTVENFYNK